MNHKLISALDQVRGLSKITVGHIVDHVEGEATLILCLILIVPFMQPIPLPGISSLLGLIILLQGVGLLFWGKPILTKKLREMTISRDKFEIIYKTALKFCSITSRFSSFKNPVINTRFSHMLCGFSIIISAAFLSLPLPIPFSNLIPALSIFLICLGLIEEDILFVMTGLGITSAILWMMSYSYHLVIENFKVWF